MFPHIKTDIHKKTLTVTGSFWQQLAHYQHATVQKEPLWLGKAEVGANRGECVQSLQNNTRSRLLEQHWKVSAYFFFFFSSSSLLSCCYTNAQLCRNIQASQVTMKHGNAFGSNDLIVKAASWGFLCKRYTCLRTAAERNTPFHFYSELSG